MANFVITHAKSDTIADWSGVVTVANSTGGTTTDQASNLIRPSDWNSAHNVAMTLSLSDLGGFFNANNGLTVQSSGTGVTVGEALEDYFEPFPLPNTNSTLAAQGMGTWYLDPFMCVEGMKQGRLNFFYSQHSTMFKFGVVVQTNTASSGSASRTAQFSHMMCIYSQGTGANTTRLESYWTGANVISATWSQTFTCPSNTAVSLANYLTVGMPFNIDTAGNVTSTTYGASGQTSVGATSMASTLPDSSITGAQNYISGSVMGMVPFNTTLAPGNYWMAHAYTTASGGLATAQQNLSGGTCFTTGVAYLGLLENQLSAYKMLGKATSANSSTQALPFHGFMSTSSLPVATAGTAQVTAAQSVRMYWNYFQDSI